MTSVVGLVLVAMTGLTVTNHYHQNAVGGGGESSAKSLSSVDRRRQSVKDLEMALAKEDEALWASYERLQMQHHPKNLQKGLHGAAAASVDPSRLGNFVYSFNTKSALTAAGDGAEFVVRDVNRDGDAAAAAAADDDDEDPANGGGPRAHPIILSTTEETATTPDGQLHDAEQQQRPFDFYDPSLTVVQKREYVKKVVYFSIPPFILLVRLESGILIAMRSSMQSFCFL